MRVCSPSFGQAHALITWHSCHYQGRVDLDEFDNNYLEITRALHMPLGTKIRMRLCMKGLTERDHQAWHTERLFQEISVSSNALDILWT